MVHLFAKHPKYWIPVVAVSIAIAAVLLLIPISAPLSVAQSGGSPDDEITPSEAEPDLAGSPTTWCANQIMDTGSENPNCKNPKPPGPDPWPSPNPADPNSGPSGLPSTGGPVNKPGNVAELTTYGNSIIDNNTFAYVHYANDYVPGIPAQGSSGTCGTCSSNTSGLMAPQLSWADLVIQRYHRFRDMGHVSSLGPGVFLNYDIKIHLITYAEFPNGGLSNAIDLIDPTRLQPVRFGQQSSTTGVYIDSKLKSSGKLYVYDSSNQLTSSFDEAASAKLVLYTGEKFFFEIVQAEQGYIGTFWDETSSPIYNGRLTRIEDRNGYGVSVAYSVNSGSGDTLWKISTVTADSGGQATFTYHTNQVGGRWAVSQIALPGSQTVSYTYSDGKLSSIQYPDGTSSSFTFSTDGYVVTAGFADAGASGTHRTKTVSLTTDSSDVAGEDDYIINQSSALVRMVTNGNDQVSYFNMVAYDQNNMMFSNIYLGKGKMAKVKSNAAMTSVPTMSAYLKDGWTYSTSTGLSGSSESWIEVPGGCNRSRPVWQE